MLDIVRKEIDGSHYYFVNGEFYPSVTRILDEAGPMPYSLKQFFINNNSEQIDEIKNTALGLGSKMHDAYERLLNGVELNLAKDYPTTKEKRHIASFVQWFNEVGPTKIHTEQTVASVKYKYAGTIDLSCLINDEPWIIDFKTSAGIYTSYEWQVAAYKQAYEEMYNTKAIRTGILRTNTRHKCGYEFKEVNRPFSEFNNIYQIYLAQNDGKIPEPPMIDVYPDIIRLEINEKN